MTVISKELIIHPKLFAEPGPLPDTYALGAAMATSGSLTRWFRDNFAQVETDLEQKLAINAYQLLSDQAGEVSPGSDGLVALPYFAGERTPIWDPLARGTIIGLTLSHTRKHVYRALLEGVAYGLRNNLEVMEEAGAKLKRIIAAGGGTKSRVWLQIVSDVIGADQELVESPFGAPYGDAFLAGYGAGVFDDLCPLGDTWVRKIGTVRHNPRVKAVYDSYYSEYRELYPRLRESMHALAGLSAHGNGLQS
jgi:xylulokinase